MRYIFAAAVILMFTGWLTALFSNDPLDRIIGRTNNGMVAAGLMLISGIACLAAGIVVALINF